MSTEHPKVPAEIESGIQNFDHGKLKHAETAEKNPLPSSESWYRVLPFLLSIKRNFIGTGLIWDWELVIVGFICLKPGPHSTLATIVVEFGDSPETGIWRQSPNSATIVASVDRALVSM